MLVILYMVANIRIEGIIIYEHTSHPSNIKNWPSIDLLPIHLKWSRVEYSPTILRWHIWETRKVLYYQGANVYLIMWQIRLLCHNNDVLIKTHIVYFAAYKKLYSFKCLCNYANFSHEVYVDLKESIVHWCWHFILATKIFLSFFDMVGSFITYARENSNGLRSKL